MNKFRLLYLLLFALILSSCSDDDKLEGGSYLDTETPELSELDQWIRQEYTYPYNIEVIYRWTEAEVDLNRYLYPPYKDNVKPALEVVKQVWIDTYTEVGGEDFVKKISPRQILVAGGINLNQSATITLGLAEGGKKITFFQTDFLEPGNRASVVQFIRTTQHEYTHILNQTKPFNEEAYGKITPSNYTGSWFNSTDEASRELGYITAYARAEVVEDFAEMVAEMLTRSKTDWDNLIASINNEEARENIRKKEDMVAEYFESAFGISIYDLQDKADEHLTNVVNNN
ncbi:MAG: substrate import-associated zinc metallohydrolase lipoprotein [Mesonia hippocampi]|uniref:substrate import-associated zinc metallohydrolase lipoprotein n=1 Tax=Mesonia hippocampi TaxID=1628250 RepID=UPI003F98F3BD